MRPVNPIRSSIAGVLIGALPGAGGPIQAQGHMQLLLRIQL